MWTKITKEKKQLNSGVTGVCLTEK